MIYLLLPIFLVSSKDKNNDLLNSSNITCYNNNNDLYSNTPLSFLAGLNALLRGVLGKFTHGMRTNSANRAGRKRSEEVKTSSSSSLQQDLEILLQKYLDVDSNSQNSGNNEQFAKRNRENVDGVNSRNRQNEQFVKKADFGYSGNNKKRKKHFMRKNNKKNTGIVYDDNLLGGDKKSDNDKYTRELYKYLGVLYTLVDKEIKRIDKRRAMGRRQNELMNLDVFNSK